MSGPIKFDSGLNGINNGLAGIQKTASQVASKEAMEADNPVDTAKSMVDLKIYSHQVEASAMVVKITDQVLGAIIDIKA
ncbi:MAG: flagellar biosynthesis protein FlgE [Gammaproteobacteria bacterium]|nr:flagellar biosynthesis protein FlgE [Gammaproteobacteria bacterium]